MKIGRRSGVGIAVAALLTGWLGAGRPQPPAWATGPTGTTITATKSVTGFWEERRVYDWTIEKSASPGHLTIAEGRSSAITYTLSVNRTLASQTSLIGVRGTITVKNSGRRPTENLKIVDQVECRQGYGSFRPLAGATQTIIPDKQLYPGETRSFDYEILFSPTPGAQYRNTATVTIANAAGYYDSGSSTKPKAAFQIPDEPTYQRTDARADVTDVALCPSGFSCSRVDTGDGTGPWHFYDDATVQYQVKVQNQSAECNQTALLKNTATLTERDTDETRESSATVTIATGDCLADIAAKKSATGFWERSIAYQWALKKTAKPEWLSVGPGETGAITYTIKATRSIVSQSDTVGVRGTITVTNDGKKATEGLSIVDEVQCKTKYDDAFQTVASKPIPAGDPIGPGESRDYPYEITFSPTANAIYRNVVRVTVTNQKGCTTDSFTTEAEAPFTLPNPTVIGETDESATVRDPGPTCPPGFECSSSCPGVWSFTKSDEVTCVFKLKNTSCGCEQRHVLANTATLTESDSKALRRDTAAVKLETGDCPGTTLDVQKSANGFCEKQTVYDWTLTKKPYPAEVEVERYDKASVSYTLTATRKLVASGEQKCGVRGEICVENTGKEPTQGLKIVDTVQSRLGSKLFKNLVTVAIDTSAKPVLMPGERCCYPYEITFTPVKAPSSSYGYGPPVTVSYRNVVKVSIENHRDSYGKENEVEDIEPFSLPAYPTAKEIDETADIYDALDCPEGFECHVVDTGDGEGPWHLTGSDTIRYRVDLKNKKAKCGEECYLRNQATLVESDTTEKRMAYSAVEVTTPECDDEDGGNGCVLDLAYWRDNPAKWPAKFSPIARFYDTMENWLGILTTPTKGDPYLRLARQYVVAVLNEGAGAYLPDAVRAAKESAAAWLKSHTPVYGPKSPAYGDPDAYEPLLETLTLFNNGEYGVPKCPPSTPPKPY